jgi:subtilisin family serine protease
MRSSLLFAALVFVSVALSGVPVHFSGQQVDSMASSAMDGPSLLTDVVVEVQGEGAFETVTALASSLGIGIEFSSWETGIITLDSQCMDGEMLARISEVPGVSSISSERRARTMFTPSDTSLSLQWGLDTVNAYEAWDITRGTHDVIVGVLDTGIDWNHPDLAGNIWTGDDGYHGYNFIDGNHIPMDDNINSFDESGSFVPNTYTYHGTHVAGVLAATINNDLGIAGISQARMMAVKVMNDSGEGTDATVASGIRWAVDHGADIVTMSLGVEGASTALENAIEYASSHGVVMVAASGNSGSSFVSYPAAYASVIAVGAVNNANERAAFSNFGNNLDVMAPGVQIYSTQGSSGYQYLSGTSTATPFVAGVAALMLSVNPALTPTDIGNVINATATDISRTSYDTMTGWGIVDAFRAVEQIAGPTVTITDYPDYAIPNRTFSISWLVSGGQPGNIQLTYLTWGESPAMMTGRSADFTGTTWARFSVEDIQAPGYNTTLYIRAYANVDGTLYESALLELPVHEPPPEGLFTQFLKDVHDFIFNDLGVYNFLLLVCLLIAIPAIALAARSRRRRRVPVMMPSLQPAMPQYSPAPAAQYTPPPPPPPPRFEAYVDLVGHEVIPAVIKVIEGTKVVWVNRSWAPPPGIAVKSGRLDQTGEHPDGMFQSGLLIAPGDYWSATFHRVGTYEYYLTGIWKTAKIVVEPFRPASGQIASGA